MRYRSRYAWGVRPLAHLIWFSVSFVVAFTTLVVLLNLLPRSPVPIPTDETPAAGTPDHNSIFHKSRRPE